MKYLPKGHSVLYIFRDDINGNVWRSFKEMGISYERENKSTLAMGFISGDTEEKGVSLVALDNPKLCFLHVENRDKNIEVVRKLLRRGYISGSEVRESSRKALDKDCLMTGPSPTCPY